MTTGVTVSLSELISLRRYANLPMRQAIFAYGSTGAHRSKLRGRGMDFSEARNYQAGDEIRHMEWRVTARTGRPHVKVYHEECEQPVVLLVDFSSSMYFGTRVAFKSVVAARLAALLAWTAAERRDRVGGLVFSSTTHDECIPRSRATGVLSLLATFVRYTQYITAAEQRCNNVENPSAKSLLYALKRVGRVTKPGSLVILISDFYTFDQRIEKQISRLRQHNDMMVYHVCDPLELAPPSPGAYLISDGHTTRLLDTSLDAVRFSYQHACDQRVMLLRNYCQRLGIRYTQVTAENDLPSVVRDTFLRRGSYG